MLRFKTFVENESLKLMGPGFTFVRGCSRHVSIRSSHSYRIILKTTEPRCEKTGLRGLWRHKPDCAVTEDG